MGKKKAKVGRPPKSAKEKQDYCIMVRLTEGEKRFVDQAANKADMPVASWVAMLIRERMK